MPLLGIFLLVDRAPRRWYTVAAIWALLAVTIVADKIAITGTAVPLVLVGFIYATGRGPTGGAGRIGELGPAAGKPAQRGRGPVTAGGSARPLV